MKIKIDGRSFIYPDSDIEWFDSLGNIKYQLMSRIVRSRPSKGDKLDPENFDNFNKIELKDKIVWINKVKITEQVIESIVNKDNENMVKIKSGGRWFEYPEDQIESWDADGNIKWSDKVHWKFLRGRPQKGDEFVYIEDRFINNVYETYYKKYRKNKDIESNNLSLSINNNNLILVGPAPTVLDKHDQIESFDYVVRLNDSYKTTGIEKDYGKRTDILYLNGDRTRKLLNDNNKLSFYYNDIISNPFNTKFICCKNNISRNFIKNGVYMSRRKKFDEVYDKVSGYNNCKKGNGFNIALISIMDLLLYNIKSLHVIGLTFYDPEENYYNNNHVMNINNLEKKILMCDPSINKHPQKEQKVFLYNLYLNDERLSFDNKTLYYLTKDIVQKF